MVDQRDHAEGLVLVELAVAFMQASKYPVEAGTIPAMLSLV